MVEIPALKRLAADMADRPLTLFGINTDEDRAVFTRKLEETGITWPVGFDGSTRGPVTTRWNISAFPTLFVIDGGGVIRARNVFGADLTRLLDELVADEESRDEGDEIPPDRGAGRE